MNTRVAFGQKLSAVLSLAQLLNFFKDESRSFVCNNRK